MDPTVVASIVAVVGTLASGIIAHSLGLRQARLESTSRLTQQRDEFERTEKARVSDQRRQTFIALNSSARSYLSSMSRLSHELSMPEGALPEVLSSRAMFKADYSRAQMEIPDETLEVATRVDHALASTYGRSRRLSGGRPRIGDSKEALEVDIKNCWRLIKEMRNQMRSELGVVSGQSQF